MGEASVIAPLAFITSRTALRLLVAEMVDHISKAGICDVPPEVIEQARRSVETAARVASAG